MENDTVQRASGGLGELVSVTFSAGVVVGEWWTVWLHAWKVGPSRVLQVLH
jgi:hypothetical protein